MPQLGTVLWLLAGGSCLGIVMRTTVPALAWMALTCLLHASGAMSPVAGLPSLWLTLYAALAVGECGMLPVSGFAYFALLVPLSVTATVPFAFDRLVAPRLPGAASTLIFPAAWVAAEFLRSRFTSSATWGSIAYTQLGNLPLMQVAAFVGIWGVTFAVAWFASTFTLAWSHGFAWTVVRMPVLICGAALGAVLLGGSVRLARAPTDRPTIRTSTINRPTDLFVAGEMTRLAEGRVTPEERQRLGAKLARLHDWFLDGSRREARAGSRLIVWPEQNLLIFKDDEPAFLERAQRLASDERVYLAMGLGTIHLGERLPFENKLVLIDAAGQIVVSYLKSHAVGGWEASIMRVGDGRLPVVQTQEGRMAGAICFDADFPAFIRQAATASADLLIVPVNDWRDIKTIHFTMHAYRAIETGLPLVRAAASGLSSAFDPWGRTLGVADFFAAGDRTLTVQVPMGRVPTLYAKVGDLFAWACVGALVVGVAAAFIRPA